jgi:uncharacterized protein YbaP (TraB family)
MTAAGHPPLWRAERDGTRVSIFGSRPPLPIAWTAPQAEAALNGAREYWQEIPEITPESQALALQHGIDPDTPLDTRLTSTTRSRLGAAAAELGVPWALLAPMRPWLAAQALRMASDARRGVDPTTAPESVFRTRASQARIPIRSEFATAAALMEFFGALPPQAEIDLLSLELDDITADVAAVRRRAELWLQGDLTYEEEHAAMVQRNYPALYEHGVVARNEAWLPRIEALLQSETPAFIVVGVGHMVGSGSLREQLSQAGIDLQRV